MVIDGEDVCGVITQNHRGTHRGIGGLQAHDLRWLWALQVDGVSQSVSFCY